MSAVDAALSIAVAAAVFGASLRLGDWCARADQPLRQGLARLLTLPSTYLHELAHAAASIACTGRGRVRLHSVHRGSDRVDGQIALGSADVWYRGPRTNALVSAAPALLWWPLAACAGAWALAGQGGTAAAALAGALAYAGRLSDSDLEHLRGATTERSHRRR